MVQRRSVHGLRAGLLWLGLCCVVLLVGIDGALGHSEAPKTVPADRSELVAAPDKIQFNFPEAVRLTSVRVFDVGDKEIGLPGKRDMTVAKERQVRIPILPEGQYRVEWRALSGDGHPISGSFRFTVLSGN